MYYNNYRPGCHFDMNRNCCQNGRNDRQNWDREDDKKDNDYDRQECCFPIDLCFSVKESKKDFDRKEKDENEYGYEYENNYGYNDKYDYDDKDQEYGKCQNKNGNNKKKCRHECCFPIDICLKVKEGRKDFDRKEEDYDDCDERHDWDREEKCERNNWNKNDRCDWGKGKNNQRPNNRPNNCCLGLLGCLFCGRRRF